MEDKISGLSCISAVDKGKALLVDTDKVMEDKISRFSCISTADKGEAPLIDTDKVMEDKISKLSCISTVNKGEIPLIDTDKIDFLQKQNITKEFQSSKYDTLNVFISTIKSSVNVTKRGRGRPRKYDSNCVPKIGSSESFRSTSLPPSSVSSTRKELIDDGGLVDTAVPDFTPHILQVPKGKDIVKHIKSFGQKGGDSVCVLSASGAVNRVSLQFAGSPEALKFGKGLYEILTLGGSITVCGKGSRSHKKNTLNISFANGEGMVHGGSVAGPLIVAGPAPVQVILGTYEQIISSPKKRKRSASSAGASKSKSKSKSVSFMSSPDSVQVDGIGDQYNVIALCPEPISFVPAEAEADDADADAINFNFTSPENLPVLQLPAASSHEKEKQQQQPECDEEITPNDMNLKD